MNYVGNSVWQNHLTGTLEQSIVPATGFIRDLFIPHDRNCCGRSAESNRILKAKPTFQQISAQD